VALARLGLLLSVFGAVVFVMMRMPALPTHFQIDGQLAEYLAWTKAPEAIGNSFNQELNPRLFSVYYPAMGFLVRYVDRLTLLCGAFAVELIMLAAALYWLSLTLTRNALASSLVSLSVLWGNSMAASLGGSSGVGLVCNPEFPATAMICVAMALSWRGRHVWACLLAGLAFNAHGSIALFGGAMLCGAAIIDGLRRGRWRPAIAACVVCALAAAPTVFWAFSTTAPTGDVSIEEWLRFPRWIYPHHIFVSETPAIGWLRLAALLVPGVMGWAAARSALREKLTIVEGWLFAAAILLAAGYVLVEVWPVRFVAQLTLWRGTRFILFAGIAVGIAWLIDIAKSGGLSAVLAGVALTGFLAPMAPALAAPAHAATALLIAITALRTRGSWRWMGFALCAIPMALLADEWPALARMTSYMAPRWGVVVVGVATLLVWATRDGRPLRPIGLIAFVMAACAFVQAVGMAPTFDGVQKRRADALLKLASEIRRACPPGRIVVAPPDLRNPGAWADRGSFLCRQQLTVYAYGPWLVDRLYERMSWYLGDDARNVAPDGSMMRRLADGYRRRSTAAFEELRERYGVGLAIVELDQRLDFGVVAENDVFRVYDLSAPLARAQARGDVVE